MKPEIRRAFFRIARFCIIIALLIGGVAWFREHLASRQSEQAIINAELLQIRTPISGQLELTGIRPGTFLKKGEPLLKIVNSRFGDRASSANANIEHAQVAALESELLGAQHSIDVEAVTQTQFRRLYLSGSIARQEKEKAEMRYTMAVDLARVKKEQLARARERARLMTEQAEMQKECLLTMPADGVVWAVSAKPGEQVDANQLVMEIINPEHIWVDAFFAERYANELRPGLPVAIQSLDGRGNWTGVLQSVRAGVGRMAVDSSVAVPPPEAVKRQVAVRIEAKWTGNFDPVEFCRVGRSVQVSYARTDEKATRDDAGVVATPATVSINR